MDRDRIIPPLAEPTILIGVRTDAMRAAYRLGKSNGVQKAELAQVARDAPGNGRRHWLGARFSQ
jgi:hypothetical protein